MREGFTSSKSFSQDIIYQINKKLSDEPPEKSKAFLMLNTLVSHISIQDFILFSAVGEKNNEGGVKTASIPELNVDDHLLMWSDLYGIMLLSAEPYEGKDPKNLDGKHFILFDCLPPFVVGVSIKDGKMSIISEIEDTEVNNKKAELIGDFLLQLSLKSGIYLEKKMM